MTTVKFMKIIFTASIIMSLGFSVAHADKPMYKWKDANGEIKYTQFKPPVGIPYTTIKHRVSKEETLIPATKATAESEEDEILRKQKNEHDRIKAANEVLKQKNCEIAQNNLKMLETKSRITVEVDGEKRYLSDEEKRSRMKQAQENVKKYCK